jgi:hypothetical protein
LLDFVEKQARPVLGDCLSGYTCFYFFHKKLILAIPRPPTLFNEERLCFSSLLHNTYFLPERESPYRVKGYFVSLK